MVGADVFDPPILAAFSSITLVASLLAIHVDWLAATVALLLHLEAIFSQPYIFAGINQPITSSVAATTSLGTTLAGSQPAVAGGLCVFICAYLKKRLIGSLDGKG